MDAYYCPNAYPYSYIPSRYKTTHLDRSFPEHHHPFESTRHRISQGFHNFYNITDNILSTRTDVRETLHNYYIDVELPDVELKDHLKLKWTNASTLIVEATKTRKDIAETVGTGPEGVTGESAGVTDKQTEAAKGHVQDPVHLLVKEREIVSLARVFDFPIQVDREKMTAKLQHGLLAIVVPKIEEAKVEHKNVEIEHSGA